MNYHDDHLRPCADCRAVLLRIGLPIAEGTFMPTCLVCQFRGTGDLKTAYYCPSCACPTCLPRTEARLRQQSDEHELRRRMAVADAERAAYEGEVRERMEERDSVVWLLLTAAKFQQERNPKQTQLYEDAVHAVAQGMELSHGDVRKIFDRHASTIAQRVVTEREGGLVQEHLPWALGTVALPRLCLHCGDSYQSPKRHRRGCPGWRHAGGRWLERDEANNKWKIT